ncbi:MAG: HprK-related kinase A [Halioglobus sp.]|jgi:HprK-related kinase A
MQLLKHLSPEEFEERLAKGKLAVKVGPYNYRMQSDIPTVATGIETLYADFPLAGANEYIDYKVALNSRSLLQRLKGQAEFLFDEQSPFDTIPRGQAYAFLEWGMNWCVSLHTNEYLKLHAGVVSKDGVSIILPGVPGAGKSTLCAALGLRGWRILSDEHAMIPPGTTQLIPLPRPVSLKNESIDVIKAFAPEAVFGPVSRETHKGVVAHMKSDLHPDCHDVSPLRANIMIFPKYSKEDTQQLSARSRTESFILAAYHSFNYSLMCEQGFEAMKTLLNSVTCYDLVYHDLDWAIDTINNLPPTTSP